MNLREMPGFEDILGNSGSLRHLAWKAKLVAQREVTVLLTGESGTGKEMIARAIHRASHRGEKDEKFERFVVINCASIPKDLLESELFGHERGAFTGAKGEQIGAFQRADGGTLFMDEVGELSPDHQSKLLRALQPTGDDPCQRNIRRVGGKKEIAVNVRVIAATNRDLLSGGFRDDLYWRLASVRLQLPPLRERSTDIQILAKAFIDKLNDQFAKLEPLYQRKSLTRAALDILLKHPWPGNIRELQSVLTEAAIFSPSAAKEISGREIRAVLQTIVSESEKTVFLRSRGPGFELPKRLAEIENAFINDALRETGGNQTEAGKLLGISQQRVSRKLKEFATKRGLEG